MNKQTVYYAAVDLASNSIVSNWTTNLDSARNAAIQGAKAGKPLAVVQLICVYGEVTETKEIVWSPEGDLSHD